MNVRRFLAIAALVAAICAPRPVAADPVWVLIPLPVQTLPNVMCLYDQTLDRVLQVYMTNGGAYHLDPSNESHTGRWIDPGYLLEFHDKDPMNHCDIVINAAQVDLPFTFAMMEYDHRLRLQYELTHTPTPAVFP